MTYLWHCNKYWEGNQQTDTDCNGTGKQKTMGVQNSVSGGTKQRMKKRKQESNEVIQFPVL